MATMLRNDRSASQPLVRADRFFSSRLWKRHLSRAASRALRPWLKTKADPIWRVRLDEVQLSGANRQHAAFQAYDQDFSQFLKTVGLFPWVTACIRANSSTAAKLDVKVRRRLGGGEFEQLPDHPLVELLERPQKNRPNGKGGMALRWAAYEQLEYTGNAFLVAEGDEAVIDGRGGVANASELWLMPTKRVWVRPTEDPDLPIAGYVYAGPSAQEFIPWWKVVHVSYPNPFPEDPLFGLSKLRTLEQTLNILWGAREWSFQFFRNAARPSGIVEVPGTMDDDEYTRLSTDLDAKSAGVKSAWRPFILENGAKWNSQGASMADAEFVELWKLGREEVLAAFGCPPAIVGLLEQSGAFANVREQYRRHLTGAVMPMTDLFDDTINQHSIVTSYGDDIEVFHDYSTEEALQKDRLQEAQRDAIHLDRKVIFPNEVRARDGLDPIEGEGMDEPKPPGVNPFELMMGNKPDAKPDDDDGDETEPEDRDDDEGKLERALVYSDGLVAATIFVDRQSKMSPDDLLDWCAANGFSTRGTPWTQGDGFHVPQIPNKMIQAVCKVGPSRVVRHPDGPAFLLLPAKDGAIKAAGLGSYTAEVKHDGDARGVEWTKFLRKQEQAERMWVLFVTTKLKAYHDRILTTLRRVSTATLSLGSTELAEKAEIPGSLLADLLREGKLAEEWFDEMLDLSIATFDAGAKDQLAALLDDAAAAAVDTEALAANAGIRDRVARHVTSIEKTQVASMRAVINSAHDKGESIEQLTRTLQSRFKFEQKWKSAVIARTESVALMNAGATAGMEEAGVEQKEWLTARDADVRESHAAVDGVRVGVRENFSVGSGSGPHPGAIGLGEEDINCRCTLKAVISKS